MAQIEVEKDGKGTTTCRVIALPVAVLFQDNVYVAISPVLNLATQGETVDEAKKNFEEALHIFLDDLIASDSMDEVFGELGWEPDDAESSWLGWKPPVVVSSNTDSFHFSLPDAAIA